MNEHRVAECGPCCEGREQVDVDDWSHEGAQERPLYWMRREPLIERPRGRTNNPGPRASRCQGYRERGSFTGPRTSNESFAADLTEEGVIVTGLGRGAARGPD